VELGAYGEALIPEMVELEDDRITLAAVHAWVDHEVVKEVSGPLQRETLPHDPRLIDVPLPVRGVVLLPVGGSTGTAERVALPSTLAAPGELVDRLQLTAAVALPLLVVRFHLRTYVRTSIGRKGVVDSAHHGEWRSLVAHPAGGRAVAGSNPVSPIFPSS
jgi:hypothetical protein